MGRARAAITAAYAVLAVAAIAVIAPGDGGDVAREASSAVEVSTAAGAQSRRSPARHYPTKSQVRDAQRFAASRGGSVAFAVIGPAGRDARGRGDTRLRGRNQRQQFSSASVSKAMLLAAYLRTHKRIPASAKAPLKAMIQVSDNHAADTIYAQVGDDGLRRVARSAGMTDFEPTPGFWGGAQITAADMARFFFRLEDNLGERHRRFGMKLLAGIVSYERWGIPDGAGKGWSVWFKGGWRPGGEEENSSGPVSHQAALLRHGDGTRIAIAVLTDQAPGEGGGYATIAGIAERLTHPAP